MSSECVRGIRSKTIEPRGACMMILMLLRVVNVVAFEWKNTVQKVSVCNEI